MEEKTKMEKKDFEYNLEKQKEEIMFKVDEKEISKTISEELELNEGMYRNRKCMLDIFERRRKVIGKI